MRVYCQRQADYRYTLHALNQMRFDKGVGNAGLHTWNTYIYAHTEVSEAAVQHCPVPTASCGGEGNEEGRVDRYLEETLSARNRKQMENGKEG